MKPSLQLKVSQQLTLTPQLQQSIKLLQMSTLELHDELERQLADNPLLEMDEPASSEPEAPTPDDGGDGMVSFDWGRVRTQRLDDEEFDPLANLPCPTTLRAHLLAQLGELTLPTRDRAVVSLLIEELNEDGFLDS